MATSKRSPNTERRTMKKEIQIISRGIDSELYSKLKGTMSIPMEVYTEFNSANLFFCRSVSKQ